MDPKKQIAYGILRLISETVVAMALERANRIPGVFNGIIKNGNGASYVCPYGDNHKFSHEADMILHITSAHTNSQVARCLKDRVIIH